MAIQQTAEPISLNSAQMEGWLLPLRVDQTRDQHKQLEGQYPELFI